MPESHKDHAQTTPLTINSDVKSTLMGDEDNTIQCVFEYRKSVPLGWTAKVSAGQPSDILHGDTGNDTVTLKDGLRVTLKPVPSGGIFVYVTGIIIDDDVDHKFNDAMVFQLYDYQYLPFRQR